MEQDRAVTLEEWIWSDSEEDYLELITINDIVYAFRVEANKRKAEK